MKIKLQIKLRIRFSQLPLLFALIALATFPEVRATTLVRLSLDQLAAGSDAVASVYYSSAVSRWENGSIWTITSVKVVETKKGDLPGEISLRLPGRRVGHLNSTVEGTPKFNPGDDAVVFLKRAPAGGFTVAGWVEGTFRISRDARSGGQTVTQDSASFAVFDADTRTFRAEGIHRMPIEEFRARIAAAVARNQGENR